MSYIDAVVHDISKLMAWVSKETYNIVNEVTHESASKIESIKAIANTAVDIIRRSDICITNTDIRVLEAIGCVKAFDDSDLMLVPSFVATCIPEGEMVTTIEGVGMPFDPYTFDKKVVLKGCTRYGVYPNGKNTQEVKSDSGID